MVSPAVPFLHSITNATIPVIKAVINPNANETTMLNTVSDVSYIGIYSNVEFLIRKV